MGGKLPAEEETGSKVNGEDIVPFVVREVNGRCTVLDATAMD